MTHPARALLVFTLFAFSAQFHAGFPQPGPMPQRISPGPVVVQVTSAKDGNPVPAVLVHLGSRYGATAADGTITLDGVPAGAYPLVINQRGFMPVEKRVELLPGERSPITVQLTPVEQATVTGQVRLAGIGMPAPGARVLLSPTGVLEAIHGSFEFTTDWEGRFTLLEIPPGKYQAALSLPGCTDKTYDLDIASGPGKLQFELERIAHPASLTVQVQDSATGSAVAGAKVTLAEAWPLGIIAEAVTSSSGAALFPQLRMGRLNRAPKGETLALSRRQITVRVEAADFEPTLVMTALGSGGTLTLPINATTGISEQEPNNSLETAQPIRTGAPVEMKISPKGDGDHFRFRLDHPSFLEITLGPANPMEILMRLYHGDGSEVTHAIGYVGKKTEIKLGVLSGEYLLEIRQRYNSGASDKALSLLVKSAPAADPLEPNDTPDQARLIHSGEEMRGTFLPRNDVDHYRFQMPRPGMVRFFMESPPLEQQLTITDQAGKVRASLVAYPGRPTEFVAPLEAGPYIFAMHHRYKSVESVEPYTLRFDVAEDDLFDDPPLPKPGGRVSAKRAVALSGLLGSTINPKGDVDLFAIPTTSAGLLRVRLVTPLESIVRVRAVNGKEQAFAIAYPHKPCEIQWSAPGPMIAYLEVRHRYNSAWSASPYTLRTWWEPCDELERLGRNDTFETATPIEPGEALRGSTTPRGDIDFYRIDLDHPAFLRIEGTTLTESIIRIYDSKGKALAQPIFYPNRLGVVGADLHVGPSFIQVMQRYGNATHIGAYSLQTHITWAEPMERAPLANDPIRLLKPDEAQTFEIDHLGDKDRFLCNVPGAGKFAVSIFCPAETAVQLFDDRTGQVVRSWIAYPGRVAKVGFEAAGPTRYRIEMNSRYNNHRYSGPGYVLLDTGERDLAAATVKAIQAPHDPTLFTFTCEPIAALGKVTRLVIDGDGDGRMDVDLTGGTSPSLRYPAEGVYPADAYMTGASGNRTVARFWVSATGPRERKGVFLAVRYPGPGQVIDCDRPCRVSAISYENARITKIALSLDGRERASAYSSPFNLEVPWTALGTGEQILTFTAMDARGNRAVVERNVTLSEYFDLNPEDGSALSGEQVRVSWFSQRFGPARVRFRMQGAEEWQEAVGESGIRRQVMLSGLEPGQVYEFQPLGAGEPGPLRTVTRVKGLAFGRMRYGAVIRRDYNQRLAVSVRNHGEAPMTVRLECGKPMDSRLLVGFVGEGSEDEPFGLAPGEEREFMLGMSAQDVIRPNHTFPVRITAENGFSDEAEVAIEVTLPRVELAWEDLGPVPDGLGRKLKLHNKGDTLTDLTIAATNPDFLISPAVEHGLLRSGRALELVLSPRLFEGFKEAETTVAALAFDKRVEHEVKVSLGENRQIFGVQLIPGQDPGAKEKPTAQQLIMRARSMAGAFLNPDSVDWSRRDLPEDSDGDGRADRWSIMDEDEDVLWLGDDTDKDDVIDFVHGDIGADGQFDYSAFKTEAGWEATNLVEAWLEVGFSLPWARNKYKAHDVDVVMNGTVIAELRDVIPEGNYTFRIPPRALKIGQGERNGVEILSKHLRGGHYVISSNFRIKVRLTGTRVWVAAGSREEADKQAGEAEGLSLAGCDYSISSDEVGTEGDLKAGKECFITVPVRNLGASPTFGVDVVLFDVNPDGQRTELERIYLNDVPLTGMALARIPWTVAAGTHTFQVVLDPEQMQDDTNRDNNQAGITFTVAGDAVPPVLQVLEPVDQAVLTQALFRIRAEATDDARIDRVEACVDNGLWQPLRIDEEGKYAAAGLLQPGAHEVRVRAVDGGGNQAERKVALQVEAELPALEILSPAAETSFEERRAQVELEWGEGAVLAAVRVNHGPWQAVPAGEGKTEVALTFGANTLEAMVADGRGVVRTVTRLLHCTKQPLPGESGGAAEQPPGESGGAAEQPPDESGVPAQQPPASGSIVIEGLGKVDLFGPWNTIVEGGEQ